MKAFIQKPIDYLKHSIHHDHRLLAVAVLLFFVLNAAKVALFNFHIISIQTGGMLLYKLFMSLLFVLIFYPYVLRIKLRLVFICVYAIQALYILVNISYFSYFHNYLNLSHSYMLFNESLLTARHFAVPLDLFQLIVLLDFPFFMIISINYNKIYAAGTKLYFYRMATLLASVLIIASLEVTSYANGASLKRVINSGFWGESRVIEKYGTVVNNLAALFLKKDENELIQRFQYGKEISNEVEKNEKASFILIQVESMDSNIINKMHGKRFVTPFLHSLSQESVYYPYMVSYHEGGCTSDAEFSSINSVEPFADDPAIKLSKYSYPNSMISALQKSSYKTIAFHGNTGDFFNRNVAFSKMGFEKFLDMRAMKMEDVGWGAPDHQVFTFAEKYLEGVGEPFISFIITMSSHEPFSSTSSYYSNNAYDDIRNETVRNYFISMSYVDQSIQDIVLQSRAAFKNTYIFIFGDHTPNIEFDDYKQASLQFDNRYFEFVPLFIITPDNKKYVEPGKAASMLDLSPTVLRNSGIKYRIRSDGENLLNFGNLSNRIPFKEGLYDRSLLRKSIKNIK
jgi:lipoteichoic acid synthase